MSLNRLPSVYVCPSDSNCPSSRSDACTTDDETLASSDKQELHAKKEALKLIEQNGSSGGGETKIKIMEQEKAFSGMSKDELMKYANDPFWIRLRWFMFILFWVVWLAMLVGALMIIVYAPKCAATEKLSWWQSGPLVTVDSAAPLDHLAAIHATGLVYKVPADDTYSPERMGAHKRAIEELAAAHKDAKVIVDLVANYVADTDDLFLQGLIDKTRRSPFVWLDKGRGAQQPPNNWLAIHSGGSAWRQLNDSSYVLSQFAENRFDLQMNAAENKERLKKVMREYGQIASVCGFRLANTQHFLVDAALDDEEDAKRSGGEYGHADYRFWTHTQTTYVAGLNDLLAELKAAAVNATAAHCEDGTFFGASDSVEFPDLYAQKSGRLTVESVPVKLNLYQREGASSGKSVNATTEAIVRELRSLQQLTEKGLYAEHQYDEGATTSEEYLFTFLLKGGVPSLTKQQLAKDADQKEPSLKLASLLAMRNSPSFTQGSFDIHQDAEGKLVGYTRVKAGSPGYLVVYNPTAESVHGNFNATGISKDLTLAVVSENYKEEKITLK